MTSFRCKFLKFDPSEDQMVLCVYVFFMMHMLVILLNAMMILHWSWIFVLLPEIIVFFFFVIGITWMLIGDYKAERKRRAGIAGKKGMRHE